MRVVRHRYATCILAVCLTHCALVAVARAQDPSLSNQSAPDQSLPKTAFEGRRIVNIAFDPADQPLEPAEIHRILPVARDQIYHSSAVRAAIERLYATGRYRDIQVDATPADGGVVIRFITKNSWFIGHVAVDSDLSDPPTAAQIVSASRLTLGVPFDELSLQAAEDNIRRLLTENGYFNPAVSHRLDYDARYSEVRITFVIDSEKRARYGYPDIQGDTSVLSTNAIVRATRWRRLLLPGFRGITQARTRTGIDNIRIKYQNANRLLATVTLKSIDEGANGNVGTPRIVVNPGPVVNVEARGARLSRKDLKRNAPIFEEHTVDADLLAEGASNLREYFQARGYFEAEVEVVEPRVRAGTTEIDYRITLGIRHRLRAVLIHGNKYFDTKTIRERMFLTPASFEILPLMLQRRFSSPRRAGHYRPLRIQRISGRKSHIPRGG